MRALVTGAGGFLGWAIVQQLQARGDSVRSFSRGEYSQLAQMGVDARRGDLRDAEAVADACRGIDLVFHVAAVSGIWGTWDHFYGINTQGTQHVIDACRCQGVKRLVYTSSPSVTFQGTDQEGIDETAPYSQRWLCHYPHTKALAEAMVLKANSRQLLTCALRPHLIWGPRDEHLIPRLIARAKSGQLRRVGDGQNLVDMIYVDNAAEAHLQAASALQFDSPVAGRAYFLSQGEPVNCWNWINDILKLAGLEPVERSISLFVAWRIGHVLEWIHRVMGWQSEPRMTRFLAAQLATSHYFDISRAHDDFGYTPSVSTAEGMRRLGQWLETT